LETRKRTKANVLWHLECLFGLPDGWMDEWMDGWMDGWRGE